MKILKWMQKKLNGSSEKKKPNSFSATLTGPQALLVIGTFGNHNLKQKSDNINTTIGDSFSSQDYVLEFTLENLQNEFNIYFREQGESNWTAEQKDNTINYIDQHLNSEHSRLEVEGKENEIFSDGSKRNGGNFYPNSNHNLNNSKSTIGKKALVFLRKKMVVCRNGFQPTPSFKDAFSTESRMGKILGTILHKKLNPQGSSSAIFIKKYLENGLNLKPENDEEEHTTDAENGSKWNKTDSEYIVLEI